MGTTACVSLVLKHGPVIAHALQRHIWCTEVWWCVVQLSSSCLPALAQGHTDVVHGIAWSADGRGIATACADQTLRIFDVHDLTSNNLKFKWIKTQYPPLAVGFGNELSQVVAVLRGESLICS